MSDVDPATAAALGWPKPKYAWVERERRWLCHHVPADRIVRSETIVDLYVTGTQLRLREATPIGGGETMRRLGRKADVSASTRLLTSIYLAPEEFRLLSHLPGTVLRKTRHYLGNFGGGELSVDRFEGALSGLIMAEGDFVIVHGRFSGIGLPRNWIAADIVRIADGVLAEHWDVLQDEAARAESKSGLPMFGDSFTG